MNVFVLLIVVILGLLFGSFLNVCISRLPAHESIVTPRSRCPHCGKQIRAWDNIPVFSWLLLNRRCRDCQTGISMRYPLVEITLSCSLGIVFFQERSGPRVSFGRGLFVRDPPRFVSLLGLAVMDLETMRLPDSFTRPGTVIANSLRQYACRMDGRYSPSPVFNLGPTPTDRL